LSITHHEFKLLCPMTGHPDLCQHHIQESPAKVSSTEVAEAYFHALSLTERHFFEAVTNQFARSHRRPATTGSLTIIA